VIALDRARAERDGGAIDVFRLQRVESQRNADYVYDRIDRADFVEMDFLDRNAMYFAFRDADLFEYGKAERGDAFVEACGLDQTDDVGVVAVILRFMIRVERYVHFERRDAFFVHSAPFQREWLDADFLQLAFYVSLIGSRVDQGGQRHVAANAGEAIEIYDSH